VLIPTRPAIFDLKAIVAGHGSHSEPCGVRRGAAYHALVRSAAITVCLDDDGHSVQRAVRDMTAGEVIAAIDHLTAGSTRIAAREKLARLRQVVAQMHPRQS
jgi:hypothetical protein